MLFSFVTPSDSVRRDVRCGPSPWRRSPWIHRDCLPLFKGSHVIQSQFAHRYSTALTKLACASAFAGLWVSVAIAPSAHALSLSDLTNKEAVSGLKEALIRGASQAADTLGKSDGFLSNPKVKIPLPQ